MHLTPLHLAYWQERKALPTWIDMVVRKTTRNLHVTIDQAVNCHDPEHRSAGPEPANTIRLLQSATRRAPLEVVLRQLAGNPDIPAKPGERRLAYAKRWARRINRAHERQQRLELTW